MFSITQTFLIILLVEKQTFHTEDVFLTILTEKFLESQRGNAAARKMMDAASGSVISVTVNSESNDVHEDSIHINEPLDHTLSGTFVQHKDK